MNASSIEIPQELWDLFSWNPPTLIPQKGKKESTRTKSPAFFDRHFSRKLVLKHVKRLPTLVHDIALTVDNAIIAVSDNGIQLPPPEEGLMTAKSRRRAQSNLKVTMPDEQAVADFYNKTTATYCAPVASTLALHPSAPDWRSLVVWTKSTLDSGYSMADGFLSFINQGEGEDELRAERAELVDSMDEEMRQKYYATMEFLLLDSLASWELNSLAAGSREVMLAIPNLSNYFKFPWTFCSSTICQSSQKHLKERLKVSEVVVRLDATNSPWNLNSRSSNNPTPHSSRVIVPLPTSPQSSRISQNPPRASTSAQTTSSMPPPALPTGSPQEPAPSAGTMSARKAPKRKRVSGDDVHVCSSLEFVDCRSTRSSTRSGLPPQIRKNPPQTATSIQARGSMPPPALPTRSLQTHVFSAGEKGKGRDDDDDDDDPSYADNYDLSAKSIVQQAWAQSVRIDGTIIVIQSGNYEFIGIRHRRTQTLYISDLIKPPTCKDPCYGKLHVGIYIAAIQDAMDRAEQHKSQFAPPDNDEETPDNGEDGLGRKMDRGEGSFQGGRKSNHGGGHRDDRRGEGSNKRREEGVDEDAGSGAGRKATNMCETAAIEKTFNLANCRDVVLLYLQYGIYDSPIPSTFVRSAALIDALEQCPTPLCSQQTIGYYQLEECLTIVLTSEIGHGATGVALRGILRVEASDQCELLDIVVKLAFTRDQRETLRNEYAIYCRLKKKGIYIGITAPLGFFNDVDGGCSALVMPYAGIPLAVMPELVIPSSHRNAALATLKAIHCAGILHSDLHGDNILVNDSGLTIIDFSHSQECNDQDAKDKEKRHFRCLLKQLERDL